MDKLEILKSVAIIIIFAKIFGLGARKLKGPQVVGEIIAGLLIGPSLLGWIEPSDFLSGMAEIGVILLMFSAGLETNLKDLMKRKQDEKIYTVNNHMYICFDLMYQSGERENIAP